MRNVIPDIITIGGSFDGTFGTGGGAGFHVNWVIRGPEASFWPVFTASTTAGVGWSVDATIDIGGTTYTGPVNEISRDFLNTNFNVDRGISGYITGGLTEVGKIGITATYEKVASGELLGKYLNIGLGLSAGPAPINGATGVEQTYTIYDQYKTNQQKKKDGEGGW
jgi:hypothetical protein